MNCNDFCVVILGGFLFLGLEYELLDVCFYWGWYSIWGLEYKVNGKVFLMEVSMKWYFFLKYLI